MAPDTSDATRQSHRDGSLTVTLACCIGVALFSMILFINAEAVGWPLDRYGHTDWLALRMAIFLPAFGLVLIVARRGFAEPLLKVLTGDPTRSASCAILLAAPLAVVIAAWAAAFARYADVRQAYRALAAVAIVAAVVLLLDAIARAVRLPLSCGKCRYPVPETERPASCPECGSLYASTRFRHGLHLQARWTQAALAAVFIGVTTACFVLSDAFESFVASRSNATLVSLATRSKTAASELRDRRAAGTLSIAQTRRAADAFLRLIRERPHEWIARESNVDDFLFGAALDGSLTEEQLDAYCDGPNARSTLSLAGPASVTSGEPFTVTLAGQVAFSARSSGDTRYMIWHTEPATDAEPLGAIAAPPYPSRYLFDLDDDTYEFATDKQRDLADSLRPPVWTFKIEEPGVHTIRVVAAWTWFADDPPFGAAPVPATADGAYDLPGPPTWIKWFHIEHEVEIVPR